MTRYTVQYELPCENPVNNVRMKRRKKSLTFFVPVNYPNAHSLDLADLLAASEVNEKLDLSTMLNMKKTG